MPSQPSLRFLLAHPAHLLACGFGSGLSPRAPGTVGTLFAWVTFPFLRAWTTDIGLLVLLAVGFAVGVPAVHKTGRDLGVVDHGSIVWDEVVPFWLVLAFCPVDGFWQLAAFVLFRVFDIAKPQPARYLDENVRNGLGVMSDDLVAAGYTLFVLALARWLWE